MNDEYEKENEVEKGYRRTAIMIFFGLFLTFAYFFHEEAGWNVNSRLALTCAMIEKRSFSIDEYPVFKKDDPLYTEDISFKDGHYYSDKIIGTSLLGAIPMTVLHLASRIMKYELSWNTKRYIIRTFSVSLLAALCAVLLFGILLNCGLSVGISAFMTVVFVFGTQMFSVSTVFLSYAPALCFVLISYKMLLSNRDRITPSILFMVGLGLGAGLLCEYTVGIILVCISTYIWIKLREKVHICFYLMGVAIPVSLFLVYIMICFGEVALPYKYLVRSEFRAGMSQGFQGIVKFNPAVLYFITIHRYRGLFYHSPVIALAIWGWIGMLRDKRWRSEGVLSIAIVVSYLLFNSSYYMWWGGWTNGPRHLIPTLPFLVIPLAWVWRSGKVGRALVVILALVSIFWNTLPGIVDSQLPQNEQAAHLYNPRIAYGKTYEDPLWELGIKKFFTGEIAKNAGELIGMHGLWSLLPLLIFWSAIGIAVIRPRTHT